MNHQSRGGGMSSLEAAELATTGAPLEALWSVERLDGNGVLV